MRKVTLGNSDTEVSALCLGTMYFGTRQKKAKSFSLMDQYFEAGGSFFDTANIYAWWEPKGAGGESEKVVGAWMKERRNRHQVFVASKVGFGYGDVPVGLTADLIERECEKSLKRLGVENIDLYYAHVDDRNTSMEETLIALSRLVRAGKIRYFGASNFTAWRLEEARSVSVTNRWPEYCCVQQRYTYLRPRRGASFSPQLAVNDDLLDYCRNRDTTLLAYSALLSGAYTRADRDIPVEYAGADTSRRLAALKGVAKAVGSSANQVVLAWMMQSDPPVLPLIAASTEKQLQENIASLDIRLSEEQMERLNGAGVKNP
ncbi:MAG: aldo/keto reductase [Chloroflexi bacterium]|jgi:aryl-alcohol dehydrogenase-like predicted oxidoreductase|nr:aldo/keto reductase [Chloroflexota bacterium]